MNNRITRNLNNHGVEINCTKKVNDILEDIECNHNHSWYQEIYERNKDSLDDIALLYKGNKITYREMFKHIEEYAKSLKTMGLGVDSEIPVCISNCPEVVYLMGAASMIGAKLNLFGAKYPNDYITEIINWGTSDVIFVEDNYYESIKEAIDDSKVNKIVMVSLCDSLKNGINPYIELETKPELYVNKVEEYRKDDDKILSQSQFINMGKDYNKELNSHSNIDTDFVITYTSGSTNEKRPKAIVHSSRSFITVGRFHNKELNGGISLKPFTFLAHIPTFSNTNLVSCISDALIQGGKLALEPCYGQNQFINTLLMYQPHYVAATKSFWVNVAKKILYNESYKSIKLSNLFLAFVCGEPFEINEEKFINKAMKKAKMGTNITRTPFSITKMSEAAGDCEHGSVFYTLFRAYTINKFDGLNFGGTSGLKHFDFVEVAALDSNGNKLPPNELGRLVANSPCTMKEYKNNEEATNNFFIKDSDGKVWADLSIYGYVDSHDKVYIRGRIPKEGEKLPTFLISKRILKDTKNILSCEVVRDDEKNAYIANIEFQPNTKKSNAYILYSSSQRCKDIVDKVGEPIYYRIKNFEESFPLTGSGKRDVKKLKSEGLDIDCVEPYYENSKFYLTNYSNSNIKLKKKIK